MTEKDTRWEQAYMFADTISDKWRPAIYMVLDHGEDLETCFPDIEIQIGEILEHADGGSLEFKYEVLVDHDNPVLMSLAKSFIMLVEAVQGASVPVVETADAALDG